MDKNIKIKRQEALDYHKQDKPGKLEVQQQKLLIARETYHSHILQVLLYLVKRYMKNQLLLMNILQKEI